MSPDRFRQMLQRKDRFLDLRWGLHPDQKVALDLGEEVPYSKRVYCWTIGQTDTSGQGGWTPLRPLLDPEGRARDPYDQDMLFLNLGSVCDHLLDYRGNISPLKNQAWERDVLGRKTEQELEDKGMADWEDRMHTDHLPRIRHALNKM